MFLWLEASQVPDQPIEAIEKTWTVTTVSAQRQSLSPTVRLYGRIESPKGELGFYLISDGTAKPYRYRVRPPSLINLTVLEDLCVGHKVADAVIILGSVDIVLGEVDR